MAGSLSLAASIFWMLCLLRCSAWSHYQQRIPNGARVTRFGKAWPGVGHFLTGGSGANNEFGLAFAAAGHQWTTDLCEADSDGDGQSNGLELGDPSCVWTSGDIPERTVAISHPGFSDTYVDEMTMTVVSPGLTTTTDPTTTTQTIRTGCGPGVSNVQRLGSGETYECVESIGDFQLHWTITGATTLDFAMVRSMSAGYMALAWPDSFHVEMRGPAFIVTAAGDVGRYILTPGHAAPTSDPTVPFPIGTTSEEEVSIQNGQVIRRFFGANMESVGVGTDFVNTVPLLWAIRNVDGFHYHGHGNSRGATTVNFAVGSSSTTATSTSGASTGTGTASTGTGTGTASTRNMPASFAARAFGWETLICLTSVASLLL